MAKKKNRKATRPKTKSVSTEKSMESSGEIGTDRINQVPDDILHSILSLLTLKEAGTTSVLSTRWRYLWTSHPCLNFDSSRVVYRLDFETEDDDYSVFSDEERIYINWVNHVIASHRATTIDQFMVHFNLDKRYSKDIDTWVDFALKKNVRTLSLDFKTHLNIIGYCDRYNFPVHLPALTSSGCNLASLRLIEVNVTGEVLGYLLSSCPLESLVVHYSASLDNLVVNAALHNLKYLELRFCFNLKMVALTVPNLLSFTCHGPRITTQLNDVHTLPKLSLGSYYCKHFLTKPLDFSSYLSQLEVLMLELSYEKEDTITKDFPQFPNLRHLEVAVFSKISLLGYTRLIKACPLLCKFSLKLLECESHSKDVQSDIVSCPHYSLKVVEVVGFVGHVWDVELISYIIKNAAMLEEIVLDTRDPFHIGSPWEFKVTKKKQYAKRCAKQLLTKLRPGVSSTII